MLSQYTKQELLLTMVHMLVTLKDLYQYAETLPGWNPHEDRSEAATKTLHLVGNTEK